MFAVRILLSAGLGVLLGSLFATALSAYALFLYQTRGAAPFIANGTTLGETIHVYYAGSVVGGLLVGVALPFLRGKLGAAVGGAIAVLPLYGAVAYTLEGPAGLRNWRLLIALAVLVGIPFGLGFRSQFGDWYDAAFGDDNDQTAAG
jgi:hypothetical protein